MVAPIQFINYKVHPPEQYQSGRWIIEWGVKPGQESETTIFEVGETPLSAEDYALLPGLGEGEELSGFFSWREILQGIGLGHLIPA